MPGSFDARIPSGCRVWPSHSRRCILEGGTKALVFWRRSGGWVCEVLGLDARACRLISRRALARGL
jgi:hypothetical protein